MYQNYAFDVIAPVAVSLNLISVYGNLAIFLYSTPFGTSQLAADPFTNPTIVPITTTGPGSDLYMHVISTTGRWFLVILGESEASYIFQFTATLENAIQSATTYDQTTQLTPYPYIDTNSTISTLVPALTWNGVQSKSIPIIQCNSNIGCDSCTSFTLTAVCDHAMKVTTEYDAEVNEQLSLLYNGNVIQTCFTDANGECDIDVSLEAFNLIATPTYKDPLTLPHLTLISSTPVLITCLDSNVVLVNSSAVIAFLLSSVLLPFPTDTPTCIHVMSYTIILDLLVHDRTDQLVSIFSFASTDGVNQFALMTSLGDEVSFSIGQNSFTIANSGSIYMNVWTTIAITFDASNNLLQMYQKWKILGSSFSCTAESTMSQSIDVIQHTACLFIILL